MIGGAHRHAQVAHGGNALNESSSWLAVGMPSIRVRQQRLRAAFARLGVGGFLGLFPGRAWLYIVLQMGLKVLNWPCPGE